MMDRAACLYLSLRRARPCESTREEAMVNNKEERVILLRHKDRKMTLWVDLRAGDEDVWIRPVD
jgi:chemotaxis protein histidine kinase CheA